MTTNLLSIPLNQLVSSLNVYLENNSIDEQALNGLQLECTTHIKHIALAVSANQRTIQGAKAINADTLLVHHGLFWKKNPYALTGLLGKRIRALTEAQINLIAYHLPLDVHLVVGNNAQLAMLLDIEAQPAIQIFPKGLVYQAQTKKSIQAIFQKVQSQLNPNAQLYNFCQDDKNQEGSSKIIAWCSGDGGDLMESTASHCFLTGELTERHFDQAKELGIALIQAGHYATERAGIQALGRWIETSLQIKTTFIEAENPL